MNKFTFRPIDGSSIDTVMEIQKAAFAVMTDPQILRANTREILLDCLENHYGIGVYT